MTTRQDAMDRAGETGEVVFGREGKCSDERPCLPCYLDQGRCQAAPVAVAPSDAERESADYEVGEWIEQHRLAISRVARRSLVELIVFARAAAALPIDFKQATDQGGWQPAAYLLTRPSGFSWVLMPFDITPYTRAIFEAESTTIAPLYAAAPTLLGVADGDAVGGKSGSASND